MSVNAERGGKPQRVVNFMGNKISKPPESINAWEGNSSGGWRRGAPHTSLPSARPSHPARPGPRPGGPGGPGQPQPAAGAGGAGLGLGRGTLAPPAPLRTSTAPSLRPLPTSGTHGRTDGWTDRRSHGTAKRSPRALSHPRSPVGTPRSPCCHPAVTLPPPRCHPAATCCSRALLAPGVPVGTGDWDVTVSRCPPAVGPGAAPPGDKRAWHPEAGPCTGAESQCQVLVPSASGRSQSHVPVPITGSQCSVLVPAASTQCPVPAPSHWSQHPATGPSTQS